MASSPDETATASKVFEEPPSAVGSRGQTEVDASGCFACIYLASDGHWANRRAAAESDQEAAGECERHGSAEADVLRGRTGLLSWDLLFRTVLARLILAIRFR